MHPPNILSASTAYGASRQGPREAPRLDRDPQIALGLPQRGAALLVMPPDCRDMFLQALNELDVRAYCAADCREARELLQSPNAVGLIVTHVSLPDGNWCDVLRMMNDLGVPASVVVSAPEVNPTLWSEVFWRGAYDLLVQPCDWNEVCQCLEGALRSRPRQAVSAMSAA